LTSAAVESEHQLPSKSFAQRMAGDETLKLGDDVLVPAEGEVSVDPVLERSKAELVQPCDLVLGKRVVDELDEWRAPPERQGLAQDGRRVERCVRCKCGTPSGRERRESLGVELALFQLQRIARGLSHEQPAVAFTRREELT